MTQPTTLGADNGYASLVDDPTYRFDGIHDRATVTAAVEQARIRPEPTTSTGTSPNPTAPTSTPSATSATRSKPTSPPCCATSTSDPGEPRP